jgi:hypothetical protein
MYVYVCLHILHPCMCMCVDLMSIRPVHKHQGRCLCALTSNGDRGSCISASRPHRIIGRMYVCMYVCMHACMYVCMCRSMYVCIAAFATTCIHITCILAYISASRPLARWDSGLACMYVRSHAHTECRFISHAYMCAGELGIAHLSPLNISASREKYRPRSVFSYVRICVCKYVCNDVDT